MMNNAGGKVERVLELASKWQMAEALAVANESPVEQIFEGTKDLEACRALINSVNAMQGGHHAEGIADALPALTQLEQRGYGHSLDWACSEVGISLGILGNPETGLEWVGRAIVGAENRSDEAQLRRSLSDEASLFVMLDENEKSIASYEKALSLRNPPPTIREEAGILNNLAYTHLHFARRIEQDSNRRVELAQKAAECARSALEILDASPDNVRLTAWSLESLGSALSLLGKFSEAEAAFEKALPLSEPYARIHVELLTSYAWLLCESHRHDEADAMLVRAYEKAQAENQEASIDRIFETRIRLEVLLGKSADALLWSERRFRLMESQYRKRLTTVARNAEIFVELERARLTEHETHQRHDELSALNKNLDDQSRFSKDETLRDALTGCLNRRGLVVSSEPFFAPETRTALALVDIDHFKSINDRYGHEAGDGVLQEVARVFVDSLRDTDLVARFGGEEFLLLLHDIAGEAAWGTCERLRSAVEHHGWGTIAQGLSVTVSIGLAVRMENEDMDATTGKAESALHQARAHGRNKVIAGK
jgi:diguanylate cyclase (GGDEF)-like protein